MKKQVTQKFIKENYKNIISVGYCDLQTVLRYEDSKYYNAGVYGWNADIYQIDNDTVIVTGYRPFGNIKTSYEVTRKYEEEARKVVTNTPFGSEEREVKIKELLAKFVKENITKSEVTKNVPKN